MDDEEDLKKMIALIKSSQEENAQDFQYDDFINCDNSDAEENEIIYFGNNYDDCNFTSTDISTLNSYDSRSVLKPEERLVIDSCSDPELKKLLLLNRTKNFQLMQMYKKFKDLLIQCQKDINNKSEVISNFLKASQGRAHSSGAWRLAAPYFKDKKLYACPPNADTLRKIRNKELNIYDITITLKWTSLQCEKLLRAVKLNYNINQQSDVLKKIKALQQSGNKSELKEVENRMKELQREDNSEIPPVTSDQYINWMRVAEIFLQDRRTSSECKSFWHIYLHPSINKSPWTPEENEKLKKLAKKYKLQNWDNIAEELGNSRTVFTTCMNYFGNLHDKFKKGDFTVEEDAKLVQLVHRHRMGSYIQWVKIVQHFKNRTRSQLHHRYTYFLTQNDKKKGKFTDAEDTLLMILVDRFGKNYKKCSEYLPTRSMVQIKSRYNSNLQKKLKKFSFSKEEDEIILKYVKEHGEGLWTPLTNRLQRCRGQIRQRYHTMTAYFAKNPKSTLDNLPRRKRNQKEVDDPFDFLRTVADQFVNSPNIPTLQDIEKILLNYDQEETTDTAPHAAENYRVLGYNDNIDDMLTTFFCNSFKTSPSKCISSSYVKRAANDVQVVLDVLKAKLDIPQDFDEDLRLDNLDVAILNILSDKVSDRRVFKNDVSELLPPNFYSLVGLRSLLIKYYTNREDQQETEMFGGERKKHLIVNIRSDIAKHLFTLSDEARLNVEDDRKTFYKRFHALFKWPAVMTLQNPSDNLQGSSSSNFIPREIQVNRTYSKADRNRTRQVEVSTPLNSSKEVVPLKLTPVTNKSVLQDLMRDKNKKLFSMESMKFGAETKIVIKEINFRPTDNNGKASNCTSTAVKDINGDDVVTAASTETACNEPSCKSVACDGPNRKKRKLSRFVPEHGEFIVLDTEDNHMSSDDELPSNGTDDVQDLNKLEAFLKEQHGKDMPNDDDDLEDLRKLENFLKEQQEDSTGFQPY